MKIPSNNRWTQTNEGNIFGVLHDTQNININSAGQMELAYKSFSLYNSDKDDEFDSVQAIKYFNGKYIVITTDEPFEINLFTDAVTKLSAAPNLDPNTDAEVCYSRLYVTQATNFCHYDGSSWTTSLGLLDDNPHPMAVFDSQPTYKLAIGDGNQVKTYSSTHEANPNVLTLPSQFSVTSLEYRSGFLYVGTLSSSTDEARVFIWNGSGTNAQYEVNMGAQWVFALTPFGSTVAAITDTGELSLISGTSRQLLAALPVFYSKSARWLVDSTPDLGRVQFNGMVSNKDSIYINIDGQLSQGFMPEMKTGVWEYNDDTGLNHKYSLSTDNRVIDDGLSVTDSVITTSASHKLKTGDSVVFLTVQGLTGVDNNLEYFVSVVDDTKIKLALTKESLLRSEFVTITGTPNTLDRLVYIENSDYYAYYSRPRAISLTSSQENQSKNINTDILFGASIEDKDGNNFDTVNAVGSSYNIGEFTTQRIYTDAITDNWNTVFTFLDNLVMESDTVTIKTSTSQIEKPIILEGVWLSTTELNNYETQYFGAFDDIKIGDEIIFIDKYSRGQSANVIDKKTTATVVTLTLDSAVGVVNEQTQCYRTNFKVVSTLNKDDANIGYLKSQLLETTSSPWVMIKAVVKGYDVAVQMFDLKNVRNKSN